MSKIYCIPGNAGISAIAECVSGTDCSPNDPQSVVAFSKKVNAGLVVVGPEAPLVAGVADALGTAGIPVFGQ